MKARACSPRGPATPPSPPHPPVLADMPLPVKTSILSAPSTSCSSCSHCCSSLHEHAVTCVWHAVRGPTSAAPRAAQLGEIMPTGCLAFVFAGPCHIPARLGPWPVLTRKTMHRSRQGPAIAYVVAHKLKDQYIIGLTAALGGIGYSVRATRSSWQRCHNGHCACAITALRIVVDDIVVLGSAGQRMVSRAFGGKTAA